MELVERIFANRSSHKDFVETALVRLAKDQCDINIASAFFTEHDIIKGLVECGHAVRMVVRLGYPTLPDALRKVLSMRHVQVRYVTDRSFHPKLYMFGDTGALVGSANLTRAGFGLNQEIMVFIPTADNRFAELAQLFGEYWGQSKVLLPKDLDEYEKVFRSHREAMLQIEKLDDGVEAALGRVVISNINRGVPKQKPENVFVDGFRRSYQEFVDAYAGIRDAYLADGRRKCGEEKIPLRLEIDAFVSFVREEHAAGGTWEIADLYAGDRRRARVREFVELWHQQPPSWFEDVVVARSYPAVQKAFSSREAILRADDDVLFAGLNAMHSFLDRRRFFRGGTNGLRTEFYVANDGKRLRESLAYLLHGADGVVERMANLIYHPDYSLKQFGRSNVQELVGWYNRENLPIVNGRTTKIMHFLGFPVTQIG